MIHVAIPKIYNKYHPIKILKHANVLDKVNKSTLVCLLNMVTQDSYSITIHVHTIIILNISHEQ